MKKEKTVQPSSVSPTCRKTIVSGGFKWEDYSGFAHRLAKLYSIEELLLAVNKMDNQRGKLSHSHLSAIKATTSMQGQSQRRAHTGNAMRCNADTIMFYKHAIELLELYPQLKWEGSRVVDKEGNEFVVEEISVTGGRHDYPTISLRGKGGSKHISLDDLGRLSVKNHR